MFALVFAEDNPIAEREPIGIRRHSVVTASVRQTVIAWAHEDRPVGHPQHKELETRRLKEQSLIRFVQICKSGDFFGECMNDFE